MVTVTNSLLTGAIVDQAILKRVKNFTCEQPKSARNWQKAKFDIECKPDSETNE